MLLFSKEYHNHTRRNLSRHVLLAVQVLGQEYTRAFLAKTAEVFDRNLELESDNEALRAENAELARKAGKAERR